MSFVDKLGLGVAVNINLFDGTDPSAVNAQVTEVLLALLLDVVASIGPEPSPKAAEIAGSYGFVTIQDTGSSLTATYLIGSKLKGTMSSNSKMAFGDAGMAGTVQNKQGGELGKFEDALRETYLGMANDTMMIRKRRAKKRKKMMEMKKKTE